jgi:hypothetical protein
MPQRLRHTFMVEHSGTPLSSRIRWVAVAATLVLGLAAAGCGSSSSSSSSSKTSSAAAITKTAFLAKANAICKQSNVRTNAAGASLGKNPSQAQAIAVVKTKFVPSIQTSITSIRALGAPAGDGAKVTMFLSLAQADLNKVKSDPSLILSPKSPFTNFAKIAHPYGLTACAHGA